MNLLFILHHFPAYGGIERVTTILANQFATSNHVHIASAKQDFALPVYPLVSSVEIHHLPRPEPSHRDNLTKVRALCDTLAIEAIIVQSSNGEFRQLTQHLYRHASAKIVTCLHMSLMRGRPTLGSTFVDRIKKTFFPLYVSYLEAKQRYIHRKVYCFSDRYVLLSPAYISHYIELMHPKDNGVKLRSIANPCLLPPSETYTKRKREIVYVGRLDKSQKCVGRLLDIWAKLYLRFPEWRLRIVGEGPDLSALKQQASNIDRVIFDGFQEDTSVYFRQSIICCIVSDFEGLPMTLIEAASQGCIPIAYDTFSSVRDIIHHGQNGFIIPAYDKREYINTLAQLMTDSDLCARIGSQAITDAAKFDVKNIMEQWKTLLEQLSDN